MMPADSKSSMTAASKTKRRARKILADGAAPKAPAKPRSAARPTVEKKTETVQAQLSAASAPLAELAEEAPMTVILNGVPTPIMPVSPREPASTEAHREARPAAPVPGSEWTWVRSPMTATAAFLATLGMLLLGYWIGYNVGSGAVDQTAVTVAEASEKTPTLTAETVAEPSLDQAAEPESPAEEAAPTPETGLHLQVSALKSSDAALTLRAELESRGFPVRVDPASEDALVRVYVGPISDKDELKTLTAELEKEGLKPFPKRL